MSSERNISRRSALLALAASVVTPSTIAATARESEMKLVLDHVMFPVYYNNPLLEIIEEIWSERKTGEVFSAPQNPSFKGVYFKSRSTYIEYLSTVKDEPYWSNAVYLVVPKEYWGFYKNPAMINEHFLIPSFGSGYQLVSPDFPHLNSIISKDITYDGFTVLISRALEQNILSIGGKKWSLPDNMKVHEGLVHVHDIVVIDEQSKLVAPLLEANPVLRDFF